MTMHAATVLHFLKFPRVSNRPQQTVDGRAWQIVKIEAPSCWAQPYGSGGEGNVVGSGHRPAERGDRGSGDLVVAGADFGEGHRHADLREPAG